MQDACEMHAFCCNDTLPVKIATYILHTECILLLSLILDISGSLWGAFGCVRGAFWERSGCVRIIVWPEQVHSWHSGSLNRFTHDVPGHFTGVVTMSRVTLQVYSRYLGSLYRCIYDVVGHFTGVFAVSRVTLQVYWRSPGSLYRCIYDDLGHFTGGFAVSRVILLVYSYILLFAHIVVCKCWICHYV